MLSLQDLLHKVLDPLLGSVILPMPLSASVLHSVPSLWLTHRQIDCDVILQRERRLLLPDALQPKLSRGFFAHHWCARAAHMPRLATIPKAFQKSPVFPPHHKSSIVHFLGLFFFFRCFYIGLLMDVRTLSHCLKPSTVKFT